MSTHFYKTNAFGENQNNFYRIASTLKTIFIPFKHSLFPLTANDKQVGLFFYVADFAEKQNSSEFKPLVCIAVQKYQKNNSTNGKFIIFTSRILNNKRLFQLAALKIFFEATLLFTGHLSN